MALKNFKPTTPSQRQLVIVDRSGLWKGKPVKHLTEGLHSKGGRNNTGRVTARYQGGGHKRTYRMIDFKRRKLDVVGTVERLEYDPNRSAFIALIKYADGELAYILAPQRLAAGDKVVSGLSGVDVKPGNAMPLSAMPVGTIIHNVEMKLDPTRSWSAATRRWLFCAWVRANSASFRRAALPRSVRCRTRIMATSTMARRAARVGSASVRMFAASP